MSDKHKGRRKNIIIACGGTAGHIFPGLTLAGELRKRYSDRMRISFITSNNSLAQRLFYESGYNFYTLPVKGAKKRSVFGNIDFMTSLFAAAAKSMNIVFREKPDCLIAFGSYVSGPPFVAASLMKIPTIIHEQNMIMGKTNRFMSRFATKIALSFPQSPAIQKDNIVVTGNPIRETAARKSDREKALNLLGMAGDKFTILVIGGSQGSRSVNSMTVAALKDMDRLLRRRIQVLHIAGEENYKRLRSEYQSIGDLAYKTYPFFEDMGIAYSVADIAISRAGASAIFELCTHMIPSILIPYPFAEGHQIKNAKFLSDRNAAVTIEEKNLSKESLKYAILRFLEDANLRDLMRKRLGNFAIPEAARKLADEVGALVGI
ncbi:MAG: undecaprenyldiphospho-muramoylpentapeptide beta-N-acetylglucosaminyltransferase [Candidatus Omnitrophica bacterium]|nr:undecaprenyldiphospho-muramoylpentapeptide beta-N-acetylglucosaminyltransferase [Candidatus Omnitrophota bacterium]